MPRGIAPERHGLSEETTLETCLRRYKNDSLIAWHLGMPKEAVSAARVRFTPQPMKIRSSRFSKTDGVDDREYGQRIKAAAASNDAFLAALKQAHG
jgi:hypothetical protein